MSKQAAYRKLEARMLGYADLVGVLVKPAKERLVPINSTPSLQSSPINSEMQPYTGQRIFVREQVLTRLEQAAGLLTTVDPSLQLQVVYGYRALSVQQKLFNKYRRQLKPQYSGAELDEATHRLIAVPDIAGHPTGGAVDIQITKKGQPLDMGTKIWEFVKDSFTFSPYINVEARNNRLLLRDVMMRAGFAPFDGEWWHFSYGDKEWARYYMKPWALYDQVEFRSVFEGPTRISRSGTSIDS